MDRDFRRTNLSPVDLLGRAKDLVGSDFWLFFGITLVAWLLASLVPFSILLGPMMCGVFLAYRAQQKGEAVEFATLWQGFDHFGQSLIAAMVKLGVMLLASAPIVALYLFGVFSTIESVDGGGSPAPIFAVVGLFYAALGVVMWLISAAFLFVFPLIIDRGMPGWQAVQLSVQAAMGNAFGVLMVTLVNGLAILLGSLCCWVGAFFVMPFTFGMLWLAYREVFPEIGASAAPADPLNAGFE